jgi:hypothetical protein
LLAQPGEQGSGGLVCGVLRDELAGEGFLQNGLAKSADPAESVADFSVRRLDCRQSFIQYGNDLALLG